MNSVILYGNLTKDPVLRYIDRGSSKVAVVDFTLATHRHFKRANGGKDKETTFIDLQAWDSGAETIAEFCHKGDPLLIERGSLRNDNYEKDGVMQYKTKVRVEKFQLMPRKNGNVSNEENEQTEQELETVNANGSDIPF